MYKRQLLSGVGRQLQPDELLWYVRRVPVPAMGDGERCLLHFEAVDFACACCVNGQVVGTHEGGYLPFSFDITEALRAEKTTGEGSAEARFQGAESMTGDVAVEGVGDAEGDACGEGKADLEELSLIHICGNDQGGFYPHNYPSNFTGINAGRTATFARIAAKHALGVE